MEESRPSADDSRGVAFNKQKTFSDNGFHITGVLGGVDVNFLLDSGSTASLLSYEEFRKIPEELCPVLQSTNVCVQDLNGHALPVHGIGRFYIYLEDVPHAVDLLVVDMDLSAILGQDFLLQYCHHIDYKTRILQTEKTNVQCWIANEQTATNVEVKRTISIPAYCGI